MKVRYPSPFFVALVSYENTGEDSLYIPPNCWGAVGWVAIKAEDEDHVREILQVGFDYLKLRLLSIEEIEIFTNPEDIENKDSHLAENIRKWEPNKLWVIGSVGGYYGEGES